jgi:NADH dehydrogenase (ubiquinone) 1 beta subcomplex subunit 8
MLSARLARATSSRNAILAVSRLPIIQRRTFTPPEFTARKALEDKYPDYPKPDPVNDPEMNGGYINPPAIKRQHRDPTADWWDKQERRNFGEPVHEDNELLGIMAPWEYTFATPAKAFAMVGSFLAAMAGVIGTCYALYPDMPAYPREFENGLVKQLGGSGATRARQPGDSFP